MKAGRAFTLGIFVSSLVCGMWGAENQSGDDVPPTDSEPTVEVPEPQGHDYSAVITEINNLNAAIYGLETKSQAASDALAAELADLKTALGEMRGQFDAATTPATAPAGPDRHTSKALDDIQTRLGQLERVLVLGSDPGSTTWALPRLATILSGLAALLALVAIVGIFWIRPVGGNGGTAIPGSVTRQLGEIHKAVSSISAAPALKDSAESDKAVAGTLAQTSSALRATTEKAEKVHAGLSAVAEKLADIGSTLQPTVESLGAQISELEKQRATAAEQDQANAGAVDAAREEVAALQARLKQAEGTSAAFDGFWPEPFRADGPLAPWKARLVEAFDEGSDEAGALLGALVNWRLVSRESEKERDKWVEAVDAVGRSCLAFLAKEPAPEDADPIERAQVWTRSFKTLLEESFPTLKLSAVYPGDRFDTDRMEAVGSNSGGRQTVQRAVSWSIMEKTAESTQILRRAQVVTA